MTMTVARSRAGAVSTARGRRAREGDAVGRAARARARDEVVVASSLGDLSRTPSDGRPSPLDAVVRWFARQPGNLRDVTPLLRWPSERLFAWGTLRGIVGNALAVMAALCALTLFLGAADAALLMARAFVGRA